MSIASAAITVEGINSTYSLGDTLLANVGLGEVASETVKVNLVCSGLEEKTFSLYNSIPSSNSTSIEEKLTPSEIGDMYGTCHVDALYKNDSYTTGSFEIKKDFTVTLDNTLFRQKVGSRVEVKGKAVKGNGEKAGETGSVYVNVSLDGDSKIEDSVKTGEFDVSFTLSDSVSSGTHVVTAEIYDKDSSGNILNRGEARADLYIVKDASSADIAIDKQDVLPGSSVKIIPILYDNTGAEITGEEVYIKIISSTNITAYEKTLKTGEQTEIVLESNHAAGVSQITLTKGNVVGEKTFNVGEYPKLDARTENNSLILMNIGNAVYNKRVDFLIGDKTITKSVDLKIGEEKQYSLEAPAGDYTLVVKDEYGQISQSSVSLTGNSIRVNEVGAGFGALLERYPIIWIVLIIIILGGVAIIYFKNKKRHHYSFPIQEMTIRMKDKKRNPEDKVSPEVENDDLIKDDKETVNPGKVRKAEHVLVLNGQRHTAGIIVLKLKNSLSGTTRQALGRAIEGVYDFKGVPCQIGDNIIILFSPLISRSFQNEDNAVKAAIRLNEDIKAHNKKFNEKIVYGIGVNSGDIINRIEDDKLKFTSMGTTVNLARRIAELATEEVLLSKTVHEKTMNEVKVDKIAKGDGSIETFTIKRVVDNERSAKFIQDFMRRSKD